MFLTPMFDPRSSIFGLPANMVIMLAAMGVMVVGFLWLRHISEPGPLLRGEARWRYRDRGRLDRFQRLVRSLSAWPRTRAPGWWATRVEFAIAGVLLGLGSLALVNSFSAGGFHGPSTIEILATSGTAYAGILFGIWWMRRIYLAPLETDPEVGWRYRDR